MQLIEFFIKNQNVFVQYYIDGKEEMFFFFDYSIYYKDMWCERLKDLFFWFFVREELVVYLFFYYNKFGLSVMQFVIEKLKDLLSVVVVGGQQVGFLIGLFYMIYKIILIIVLVKE